MGKKKSNSSKDKVSDGCGKCMPCIVRVPEFCEEKFNPSNGDTRSEVDRLKDYIRKCLNTAPSERSDLDKEGWELVGK